MYNQRKEERIQTIPSVPADMFIHEIGKFNMEGSYTKRIPISIVDVSLRGLRFCGDIILPAQGQSNILYQVRIETLKGVLTPFATIRWGKIIKNKHVYGMQLQFRNQETFRNYAEWVFQVKNLSPQVGVSIEIREPLEHQLFQKLALQYRMTETEMVRYLGWVERKGLSIDLESVLQFKHEEQPKK